jgi:hypothetical protein
MARPGWADLCEGTHKESFDSNPAIVSRAFAGLCASLGGTAQGASCAALKMNFIFKIPDDILDHVILKVLS